MSRSLNKTLLIGHVGGDPELRTAGNTRVATFSLATSRQWTDSNGNKNDKTEWHRCVAWNNARGTGLAEIVEQYVRKGEKLYVEGAIEYRTWQDKDGQTRYTTEIRVHELMLLGAPEPDAGPREPSPRATKRAAKPSAAPGADDFGGFDDDDIPF